MPQLKKLSCCLQWSDTSAPFQEYGTVYGDGVVETFVVVPNRPCTFTIRLKSHGFIHGGLAMIVFIDGNYQCNRSRVNLQPGNKDQLPNKTEIDFLLRQKEKAHGDGIYMGRQWRFDNHNISVSILPTSHQSADLDIVADPNEGYKEGHFDDLGTIEVIVLRCAALYSEDADYDGFSSGEDSDIFGERPTREELETAGAIGNTSGQDETAAKSNVPEATIDDDVGGLFGLFDGPSDGYGPYQTHDGRWVWHPHQTSSNAFAYTPSTGNSPHPPYGPHFRTPNYNPPPRPLRPHPHQWRGRINSTAARQPERHVHWNLRPGSESSRQPYHNHFHGSPFNPRPPPQRPQSRERVRSSSQTSTGPPYPPQQMNPPQQMHSSQQMNPLHPMNQPQHMQPLQQLNASYHTPNGMSQSQQQYQGWYPEQGHNTGPIGSGYVSDFTNQTQPEALPEQSVPENPTNQPMPQAYPAWKSENDPSHQNNTGVTATTAQSGLSHIPAPDANSQQFGNQPAHFIPTTNQSWPRGPLLHAPFIPQQMSGPPMHYPPWSVPTYNMQTLPHIPFVYPQYLPVPHPTTQPAPHIVNTQNPNAHQFPASFSVPPTEGISPRNTMFNQTGQGMDTNISGNSWQNNNANIPFNNTNNNETGGWPVQENAEATQNQDWNSGNQTGPNEATNGWDNNDMNGQSDNNNDAWQSNNNNNNDTWQSNNNNNINDNSGWENAAANPPDNSWGNQVNATQANGAGDTWDAGNNDNNFQTQSGEPVNACIANMARDLYGPHGPYYSYRALTADEPKPDAEEEPRFDVPQSIATQRGSSKQVQPGPGFRYYKKCLKPEYIDSLEDPYARFVFKYRTKEQLQNEIGIEVDVEPSSDQAITELQNLDKQTLVEMLMRAKGALGGKVPSPPLTPADANGTEATKPVALPAPIYPYLRYSLPPLRPLNSNVDQKVPKSGQDLQNNQNTTNWDVPNNSTGDGWANNNANTNTQNWGGAQNQDNNNNNNWGAVNNSADNGWANNNNMNTNNQNWGGASGWDSARDDNRMPSTSNQQQQQQRPSVQFSMQSQNNEQATDGRNASQSTGQQAMPQTLIEQQNDPNNEQQGIPKPPTPAMDAWNAADAANSQTGWV